MKTIHTFASVLLLPFAGIAASKSLTNETESAFPPNPLEGLTQEIATPATPLLGSGNSEMRKELTSVSPAVMAFSESSTEVPSVSLSPLSWSSPEMRLREIPVVPLREPLRLETHGVLLRASQVTGNSLGEILLSSLQLLNPLAPSASGIETEAANWYDGTVQPTPLPFGMRDERFHEPQTSEFSASLGRWLLRFAESASGTKVYEISESRLLTSVP